MSLEERRKSICIVISNNKVSNPLLEEVEWNQILILVLLNKKEIGK